MAILDTKNGSIFEVLFWSFLSRRRRPKMGQNDRPESPKTATRTEITHFDSKICGVVTEILWPDNRIAIPQPPSFLFLKTSLEEKWREKEEAI